MPHWRRLARAESRFTGERATVAGVDEAGRGPMAGPVVAAAVVLDRGACWDGLDDSKRLSPEKREVLYARVLSGARAIRWAVVGQRAIDTVNIRRASLEAMRRAVTRLGLVPELVLVDGLDTVPGLECEQCPVVDADATLLSVAAASVVAKVVRDRIMARLDRVWPAYGFARNKGYGTPEHLAALERHGPCPLHRFTFAPVAELLLPL
ncbi:MAG: ribonuclease HII [Candidatus Eisenbacteria bacterium]